MSVQILVGDCRDVLRRLSDNHFHTVATSPPYWGLRDYGIAPVVWGGDPACAHVWGNEWLQREQAGWNRLNWTTGGQRTGTIPEGPVSQGQFCQRCGAWRGCLGLEPTPDLYVSHLVGIFREVRRVLRADGTLWLNLGDCYAGAPKGSLNGQDKSGLTSTQTQEHSPTGVNKLAIGLKPKDLVGIPWLVAFALRADGWWLRSDVIWHKPNGMPESVRDRPTSAHEYVFLLTKNERYFYDQDAIREPIAESTLGDHRLYDPDYQVGRPERNQLRTDRQDRGAGLLKPSPAGRNKRDVWTIPTHPFPDSHFATFPPALVEICLKAGASAYGCCPECGAPWERVTEKEFIPQEDVSLEKGIRGAAGQKPMDKSNHWDGIPRGSNRVTTLSFRPTCDHDRAPVACRVLDPFGGAGTTGLVADGLGLEATLIEIKAEYAEMARARAPMFASVEVVE